jgi:peptidoglycan/xylan/chitin deacetylase (PgdA/CDA1 family)/Tfp pilus assembly protein PilF
MKPQDIPILMYHEISNFNNQWSVTPENFKNQMRFLNENGYKTCSMTQLHEFLKRDQTLDNKYIVITFDDGRESVHTNALPILKQFNFTATLYLVPSWIEKIGIPQEESYSNFLNWQQIKELQQEGFEMGSHSHSHANLTKIDDLQSELLLAQQAIKTNLGSKVEHFCYPYGKYNQTILPEINQYYLTSVTVNKGFDKEPGQFSRQWVLNNTTLENFKKLLQKPTLSVCMIVKNEAKYLDLCLKSIQTLANEIIIVDTGSTDNTKEIVQKYTPFLYDFTWADDFSKARNFSLEQATCDWILIIDADEVINQQDLPRIKQAINNWQISGFNLCTKNYNNDSSIFSWQPCATTDLFEQSFAGWTPSIKVRLFQKGPIFEGTVHEQIKIGKAPLLPVYIHHHQGFSINNKSKTYLEYSKKKLGQDPQNPKILFELGIQQKQLGEHAAAEITLQQAANLENNSILPLLNLALIQQKQNKIDLAIENYQKILTKKQHPGAHFGLGYCHYQKNNLDQATKSFQKAIAINPRYVDAYINLGAISEQQQQYQQAALYLRQALKIHPTSSKAYYNFAVMHEKTQNLQHALVCYQKAVQLKHPKAQEIQTKIGHIQQFLQKNSNLSSE